MNKADKRRFLAITEIGCLACRLQFPDRNHDFSYTTDVHHLLSGGKRIGNHATIGLCPYHHRNVYDLPKEFMIENLGPSLADGIKVFEQIFPTQKELLEMQNELIEEWEE